jgi:hypothetical protein
MIQWFHNHGERGDSSSVVTDREELTEKFFAMLSRLNRQGTDILEVRDFFWTASKVRTFVPQTVEFLTVLKAYRTPLFYEFKSSLVPNSSMKMLSNVEMDVGQALINLGIRDVEQLRRLIKGKNHQQTE